MDTSRGLNEIYRRLLCEMKEEIAGILREIFASSLDP